MLIGVMHINAGPFQTATIGSLLLSVCAFSMTGRNASMRIVFVFLYNVDRDNARCQVVH